MLKEAGSNMAHQAQELHSKSKVANPHGPETLQQFATNTFHFIHVMPFIDVTLKIAFLFFCFVDVDAFLK